MTALRLAHRRLRSRSLAIGQTALAALTAWYLCVWLLPDPEPVFACIATVIAIGATHGQHGQRALHLIAGVVLGLTLSAVLVHLIGTGPWQLALLVIAAMSVGVLFNGSDLVIGEAAVSAMLLLMIGGTNAPNRIFEAVIGGVVALAIVVIFPPKAILHVGRAGQAVMAALGQSLERVAAALAAGDADKAESALVQARAIDALLDALDDALEMGRETVRTAPTRFAEREPVERYSRSFEQIDLAVRNTRVLARHAHRALRSGHAPTGVAASVTDLARAVWDLAAAFDDPARAADAREHAARAAAGAATDALGESVRSTAVDLMRAAELVAGAPDELPTEEILLALPAQPAEVVALTRSERSAASTRESSESMASAA
ncbi:FUSC family protein [Solirubrobacter phytolaccae]|uniref:FUSC family protein n=1 Tax=Solirubrobacter phytolaccae TaxID=1404360 RepID=A0A9X3NEX0_9ACTN|nr:FUSC family protein [Solirubrobacter phytolaccae]MDA0182816.1 FUSC family protein [Solirubrobacter phytolaccae]